MLPPGVSSLGAEGGGAVCAGTPSSRYVYGVSGQLRFRPGTAVVAGSGPRPRLSPIAEIKQQPILVTTASPDNFVTFRISAVLDELFSFP